MNTRTCLQCQEAKILPNHSMTLTTLQLRQSLCLFAQTYPAIECGDLNMAYSAPLLPLVPGKVWYPCSICGERRHSWSLAIQMGSVSFAGTKKLVGSCRERQPLTTQYRRNTANKGVELFYMRMFIIHISYRTKKERKKKGPKKHCTHWSAWCCVLVFGSALPTRVPPYVTTGSVYVGVFLVQVGE